MRRGHNHWQATKSRMTRNESERHASRAKVVLTKLCLNSQKTFVSGANAQLLLALPHRCQSLQCNLSNHGVIAVLSQRHSQAAAPRQGAEKEIEDR
jgi:hypothetical protein